LNKVNYDLNTPVSNIQDDLKEYVTPKETEIVLGVGLNKILE
jgi:hypothetical protein